MTEVFQTAGLPPGQAVSRRTDVVELLVRRWLGTVIDIVALVTPGFALCLGLDALL